MNIRKTVGKILGVAVLAGIAVAAHAQGGKGIDTSGMGQNSNSVQASGPADSIGLKGATNSIPGEPGGPANVIAIPEANTALLALGGLSALGTLMIRRRK